jgi:hypothetical protein
MKEYLMIRKKALLFKVSWGLDNGLGTVLGI